MPNYDFRCGNCAHKFSKRVSYDERNNTVCPECGGASKQIFTGFLHSAKSTGGSSCAKSSCSGCSSASC